MPNDRIINEICQTHEYDSRGIGKTDHVRAGKYISWKWGLSPGKLALG
jgi:hypothetical protein